MGNVVAIQEQKPGRSRGAGSSRISQKTPMPEYLLTGTDESERRSTSSR